MRTIAITMGMALLVMPTLLAGQTKPIPVGVTVEAEGEGKGRGMWSQGATDLTTREAKALESLVVTEIKRQDGVKIVPLDYSEDYVRVVVVAAKLKNGDSGKWYYIASSVLTIATKKGADELVTHDVVAGVDLASLSHSIAYLFASARLRAATGLWK